MSDRDSAAAAATQWTTQPAEIIDNTTSMMTKSADDPSEKR
jgi:hypothetical protein